MDPLITDGFMYVALLMLLVCKLRKYHTVVGVN